jgi:hypothetical protein
MDRRLGLGEPLEQLLGALASLGAQRRLVDQAEDLGEAAVRMYVVVMIMLMVMSMVMMLIVLVTMGVRRRVLGD